MNKDFDNILRERFSTDSHISIATVDNCGVPWVRIVDAIYIDGAFYTITHNSTNKMKHISDNPIVAIFSKKFNNRSLYKSFIVSFFIPVVCFLISGLLVQYADLQTNIVAIIINFIVAFPAIPANNVFLPMYNSFETSTIYLINIIPTIISFFISFMILKKRKE